MVEMPMYFHSLGANRIGAEAEFLHKGQEAESDLLLANQG